MAKMLDFAKRAAPWLLLIVAVAVVVYQNEQIASLQVSRNKREVNDGDPSNVFLPIFAKISRKNFRRMCMSNANYLDNAYMPEKKQQDVEKIKSKNRRKKCDSAATFGQIRQVASRPNAKGWAATDGRMWYVAESDYGYTLLSFADAHKLNESTPTDIHLLPYAFDSVDNVVFNGIVYYSYENQIVAFNLTSRSAKLLQLDADPKPMYKNNSSRFDVQADEHGLWVFYKKNGDSFPTAVRLQPSSLNVLATWALPSLNTSDWTNAFIRCAVLHSVRIDGKEVVVQPAYDFHAGVVVQDKPYTWSNLGLVSSVGYDPSARAIAVFAGGNIFQISTLVR